MSAGTDLECIPERCFIEISKCSVLNAGLLIQKMGLKNQDDPECQFKSRGDYLVLDIHPSKCGLQSNPGDEVTVDLQGKFKSDAENVHGNTASMKVFTSTKGN